MRWRMLQARRRLFEPHQGHRFSDYYKMGRKLGDGASADVYEAVSLPIDAHTSKPLPGGLQSQSSKPRSVAVKVFAIEAFKPGDQNSKNDVKGHPDFFKAEWEMLCQLEHPHIVRMYECFRESSALYIIMELCLGGELIEHVKEVSRRRGKGGLEEADARLLFRQMLYAGSYLHANKIVHRDIKLENFLLVGGPKSAGAAVIKLCDFGTAVMLSAQMPRAFGRIGTLSYTSPEVCADRGATVLADAWSLGVVLYVLLVGAKPFRLKLEEPRDDTMRRIQSGSYNQARPGWKTLSQQSRDLVKALITVEESQRLTSTEAIDHPWTQLDAPNISLANELGDVAGTAPHALQLLAHATRLEPLQQFVMGLCSRLISEGDLLSKGVWATWYNLFFALDSNKDGQLDFGELARGLWAVLGPAAHMSSAQMAVVLRALDLNASGAIEWTEWAAVALLSVGGVDLEDELLGTALRLLGSPRDITGSPEDPNGRFAGQGSSSLSPAVQMPRLEPRSLPSLEATGSTDKDSESPDEKSSLPPERMQQLRERFAQWLPEQEMDTGSGSALSALQARNQAAARAAAASEMCMDDLREVIESTSWFRLGEGGAGPWPEAAARPSPLSLSDSAELSARSPLSSPRDQYSSLAASPFASPRNSSRSVPKVATSPLASPRGVPIGPQSMPTARCRVPKIQADSEPNSPRGSPTSSAEVSTESSNSAQPAG